MPLRHMKLYRMLYTVWYIPYAAVSFKIPRFKPPSYTPSVKPIEKEIAVTESKKSTQNLLQRVHLSLAGYFAFYRRYPV